MNITKFSNRHLYCRDANMHVTLSDIYDAVKEGEIVLCDEEKVNLADLLMKAIYQQESIVKSDVAMMNRIIRNGGLTAYINKLEGEKNEEN